MMIFDRWDHRALWQTAKFGFAPAPEENWACERWKSLSLIRGMDTQPEVVFDALLGAGANLWPRDKVLEVPSEVMLRVQCTMYS
jgi:hypothetical protein